VIVVLSSILQESREQEIDCYPDADFTGMYGYEKSCDLSSLKSRMSFDIAVNSCPAFWQSKL